MCRKCGSCDHISNDCNEVEQCVNCRGCHIFTSRECPKFLEEIPIIKIKIDNGVSFPEAKKIFCSLPPCQGAVMQQQVLQVLLKLLPLVRVGLLVVVFWFL